MSAIPNNFERIINDQGEVIWTFKGLARPKLILPFPFRGIIEPALAFIAVITFAIIALTSREDALLGLFIKFFIFCVAIRFFFQLKKTKKIIINKEYLKFDNTSIPLNKIQDLGIATNFNKTFTSIAYIYAIVQGSEVVIASGKVDVMRGILNDIQALGEELDKD